MPALRSTGEFIHQRFVVLSSLGSLSAMVNFGSDHYDFRDGNDELAALLAIALLLLKDFLGEVPR
jgi:hypothetical protein